MLSTRKWRKAEYSKFIPFLERNNSFSKRLRCACPFNFPKNFPINHQGYIPFRNASLPSATTFPIGVSVSLRTVGLWKLVRLCGTSPQTFVSKTKMIIISPQAHKILMWPYPRFCLYSFIFLTTFKSFHFHDASTRPHRKTDILRLFESHLT